MRADAELIQDERHGETLVVTYYVRRNQVAPPRGSAEYPMAFIQKDMARRLVSLRKRWAS
jgi:hypothetical protein